MYKINKLNSINDVPNLVNQYCQSLSSPFDSFLEDHIVNSEIYEIRLDSDRIGYFCVTENVLTNFYIKSEYLVHAQDVFSYLITQKVAEKALVFTGDELLLSLCMDFHQKINLQAYLWQDNGHHKQESELDPILKDSIFRKSEPSDKRIIKEVTGDFLDDSETEIENGEIFVLFSGEALLGVGINVYSQLLPDYASIGMFVNETYRRKGIGTYLLHKLKEYCYEINKTPIAGCWYYNDNSVKTLKKTGMISKTRLLNVEF